MRPTTTLSLCAAVALTAVSVSGAPLPANATKGDVGVGVGVGGEVPALFARDLVAGQKDTKVEAGAVKETSWMRSMAKWLLWPLVRHGGLDVGAAGAVAADVKEEMGAGMPFSFDEKNGTAGWNGTAGVAASADGKGGRNASTRVLFFERNETAGAGNGTSGTAVEKDEEDGDGDAGVPFFFFERDGMADVAGAWKEEPENTPFLFSRRGVEPLPFLFGV
ncbi:uncharacterized protein K452DRAFT_299542 [Aplosporella prunicola CBS 121167]|uniref:Uncharacterized protein n=1 Tax=Aplosporella prunicola CBS 121167 TaxID=1176127 RepID=A0A6A6B9A0_9PEZI|nr:uncharacterized protein K452DRAFT_299542 [Aplosporella prunicola CBS 121167]KAF2140148.1 hypothetical protein K452DRAFT_299542 [Aplosporella prunicola CBS 121167]